jgi:hypothetical protein
MALFLLSRRLKMELVFTLDSFTYTADADALIAYCSFQMEDWQPG